LGELHKCADTRYTHKFSSIEIAESLTTTVGSPKGKKTAKLSCISTPKSIEKNQRETKRKKKKEKKKRERERERERERDTEYHMIVKAQKLM
jgi:hypothetical protein